MSTAISAEEIIQRQDEILEAMAHLRTMRRGSFSQQSYPERASRKGGQGAVGPYGLWQGTVDGERFAKRVSGEQAEHVQQGIAQRQAFMQLCEE